MIVTNEIPPIYGKLLEVFNVKWEDGILITVGETVYCNDLDVFNKRPDLFVHEKCHAVQQRKLGSSQWWKKYLEDPEFRFQEEVTAYFAQAKYVKEKIKDRNQRFPILNGMCKDLSGKMYGEMMTYQAAWRLLAL